MAPRPCEVVSCRVSGDPYGSAVGGISVCYWASFRSTSFGRASYRMIYLARLVSTVRPKYGIAFRWEPNWGDTDACLPFAKVRVAGLLSDGWLEVRLIWSKPDKNHTPLPKAVVLLDNPHCRGEQTSSSHIKSVESLHGTWSYKNYGGQYCPDAVGSKLLPSACDQELQNQTKLVVLLNFRLGTDGAKVAM